MTTPIDGCPQSLQDNCGDTHCITIWTPALKVMNKDSNQKKKKDVNNVFSQKL